MWGCFEAGNNCWVHKRQWARSAEKRAVIVKCVKGLPHAPSSSSTSAGVHFRAVAVTRTRRISDKQGLPLCNFPAGPDELMLHADSHRRGSIIGSHQEIPRSPSHHLPTTLGVLRSPPTRAASRVQPQFRCVVVLLWMWLTVIHASVRAPPVRHHAMMSALATGITPIG